MTKTSKAALQGCCGRAAGHATVQARPACGGPAAIPTILASKLSLNMLCNYPASASLSHYHAGMVASTPCTRLQEEQCWHHGTALAPAARAAGEAGIVAVVGPCMRPSRSACDTTRSTTSHLLLPWRAAGASPAHQLWRWRPCAGRYSALVASRHHLQRAAAVR